MRALALTLALTLGARAFAADPLPADVPVMVPIIGGAVSLQDGSIRDLPRGYFVNDRGYAKLAAVTDAQQRQVAALQAENEQLKKQTDQAVADSTKRFWIALGIILLSGVATAAVVTTH